LGGAPEGFETVRDFLQRFGYLGRATGAKAAAAVLDDAISTALAKYQQRHRLNPSGIFDESTKQMMMMPRCGLPDPQEDSAIAFSVACVWAKRDSLTYAFECDTGDLPKDAERAAVRRALATWSAIVQISFREVSAGDSPDIMIAWGQANEADRDMIGSILARADYPPGLGYMDNSLPRALHFDDQVHTWCIGAEVGHFDVETVALHEIGHLLGLQHSSATGAVMFPVLAPHSTNRFLAVPDIEGMRRLYPLAGPIFGRHGICLDIEGGSTSPGAHAIVWTYWGGRNQLFKVEWVENGYYRLVAEHSGRVVDVDGASTSFGAHVIQWDWWGGDNQKFWLGPLGHGYFTLVAKHSGKVVDVESSFIGAHLIQTDRSELIGWRLGPARIASQLDFSTKCLDVEAMSVANGARLIQWPYWGGGNQKFRLDPVGDGYYRILIEHSGKCLDVEGASTANGARIIQWEYWGGDNQKFRPESVAWNSGYCRLVAKHSGRCLDVAGMSHDDGAPIIQWDYWGGANQHWQL
jgi:Matrixin./Putative peptidoglycan binding domain./Ricin-type beta-trefoil lectin domain.